MATGLDTFDTTVQESNLWLKDLMERLGTYNRHHAYSTLRAVLHVLRDRIGPDNAAHLGAQLPMLIRGLYYEGWHPSGKPTKERHEGQFLARVHEDAPLHRAVQRSGAIATMPILAGLHHQYVRI